MSWLSILYGGVVVEARSVIEMMIKRYIEPDVWHLPLVVRFNQLMRPLAKLKHYSAVISLYNQMGQLRNCS